jgi:hypothetical protein
MLIVSLIPYSLSSKRWFQQNSEPQINRGLLYQKSKERPGKRRREAIVVKTKTISG